MNSAVTCPVPRDVVNGRELYGNIRWGSQVLFKCDNGFRFEGTTQTEMTSECLNTTQWTLEPPDCEGGKYLFSLMNIFTK